MLTATERDLMLHAIGGAGGLHKEQPFRNYFCADFYGPDARVWHGLVQRWLAQSAPYLMAENMITFHVTAAGIAALKETPC